MLLKKLKGVSAWHREHFYDATVSYGKQSACFVLMCPRLAAKVQPWKSWAIEACSTKMPCIHRHYLANMISFRCLKQQSVTGNGQARLY